jgi:CheY-like chemotaxis protein
MLVVDDPPAICAVLGKMLRSKGYEVLSATDVSMAIEVVRDKVPAWRDQRGDEAKRPVCMHTSRLSSGRESRADGPHPTGCG